MKAHIVRIGNSRGIRLPKTLLQKAKLEMRSNFRPSLAVSSFPKWPNHAPVGTKIASSTRQLQLDLLVPIKVLSRSNVAHETTVQR